MDNRSIVRYQIGGAKGGRVRRVQPLNGLRCQLGEAQGSRKIRCRAKPRTVGLRARSEPSGGREKPLSDETSLPVPQTNTGRRVENTKAHGRTLVKELGKMGP